MSKKKSKKQLLKENKEQKLEIERLTEIIIGLKAKPKYFNKKE
jgi:hypothetical protein